MKLSLSHLAIGVLLVIGVMTFYVKSREIAFPEHERFTRNLRRIEQMDATLNQDVLRVRFHLLGNYDRFAEQLNELKQAIDDLQNVPTFIEDGQRELMLQRTAELSELLAQKSDLLEDFKSQNAVLNNSVRYFPVAGSDVVRQAASKEETRELAALCNDLMRLVLSYSLTLNEELLHDVRSAQLTVETWRANNRTAPEALALGNLLAHANSIVIRQAKVDAITRQLVSTPLGDQVGALLRAYETAFAAALNASDNYKRVLNFLCLLLVIGIAYTVFALRAANSNLDLRVRARTADLAESNEQLKSEIVERKRVEETVRAQQAQMQAMQDASPLGVFSCDTSGACLYANRMYLQITGYSLEDITGQGWKSAIHPEDREQVALNWRKATETQSHYSATLRYRRPDGEVIWASVLAAPVRENGTVTGYIGTVEDVSQRQIAEEKLAYERSLLGALMENIPDYVYFKDQESRFLKCSKAFALRLSQANPCSPLGKTDFDYFEPKYAQAERDEEQQIMRSGNPVVGKVEQEVWNDGRIDWALTTKMPLRDAQGIIVGTFGISKDITELKRAEEALRESQALYHSLVETLPVYIYRKDLEGRFTFANKRFCERKGKSVEEIIGRTVRDFAPAIYATRYEESDRKVIETGQTFEAIEEQRLPDGQKAFVQVLKVPVFNSHGKIVGSQGMYFDITERRQAEQALRDSELRLQAVWENSVDALRLTDAEGRIVAVNDSFCRLVNMPREELEGQPLTICYADERTAGERIRKHVDRFARRDIAQRQERQITFHDGRAVQLETTNSFLDVPDRPTLLLSLFRDITARKLDEAALNRAHRELVDVSRRAGMAEVATGVLHNVGNVLNSVNVAASLAVGIIRKSKVTNLAKVNTLIEDHRDDLGSFLTADAKGKQLRDYLRKLADHLVEEQAEVLGELTVLAKNIDHIKDIVSMQQNYARVSGIVEVLPLADLVEHALQMNATALSRNDVEILRDFNEAPPLPMDKHKVLQILVNLIRNAKHACDESGRPDKRLKISIKMKASDTVNVSVSDNGVGIAPENLTRVFSHGFTTRKHGHGFGLHSGALAAREMGGSLSVFSEGSGCGATFTLELPLQPDDSQVQARD